MEHRGCNDTSLALQHDRDKTVSLITYPHVRVQQKYERIKDLKCQRAERMEDFLLGLC